ncbi:MAG TPA: B12-binding domain-containing radical SAM protein [Longilinea sp.]|nr:B12-binding domain-containing radical SAM protein [Longilinea sp.]
MRILLVQPEFPVTFWSFKYALDFVDKKVSNPPLGLLTVAALLPEQWEKKLVDLNINPLTDEDLGWADYLFIGAMDIQRKSVKQVIRQAKEKQIKIVAGGPLFTGEYNNFPDVDHFILNEGEITLLQFLSDLEAGHPQRLYRTDDYADIRQSPIPIWNLLKFDAYDSMAVQFSRGCPYNCDFCNVTALLGHKPRTKSAEQLIAELDQMYQLGWRRNIFIVDDNFIGNKKQLKEEILPALIEWRKDKIGCLFITEASINLADDDELIQLMVSAGFVSIFIGIETPDDASLTECNKSQNRNRDLIQAVTKLQHAGLHIMAGFIVGFDSDTQSIFDRQIQFIQDSGIIVAMVGLLQAPFGTRLYERLQNEGRLLSEMTGDNTDGSTNIVSKMDQAELSRGYQKVIQTIYSPKLFYARVKTFLRNYRPSKLPVHLEIQEIRAFFRSIWKLGILGKERKQYWNLFIWTLFHLPSRMPMAITLTIYGYHFRKIVEAQVLADTVKLTNQKVQAERKSEPLTLAASKGIYHNK